MLALSLPLVWSKVLEKKSTRPCMRAAASHQLFSNALFRSISPHLENLLPKIPASTESSEGSPDRANSSQSLPASRNGVTEPSTTPSTSMPKEHGNLPIIVPMIPPPLIKPPTGRTPFWKEATF